MFGRVPGTRPNISESHSEISTRVPFCIVLAGLREVERDLRAHGIPFFLLRGDVEETLPALVRKLAAQALVMDFSPLRIGKKWREGVAAVRPCHIRREGGAIPCNFGRSLVMSEGSEDIPL